MGIHGASLNESLSFLICYKIAIINENWSFKAPVFIYNL